MTQWATFAGLAGVVCVLLLALSHATKTTLTEPAAVSDSGSSSGSGSDSASETPPEPTTGDGSPSELESGDEATESDSHASGHDVVDDSSADGTRSESAVESSSRSLPRSRSHSHPHSNSESQRDRSESRAPPDHESSESVAKSDLADERSNSNAGDPRTRTRTRAQNDLADEEPLMESMSSGALLANVALSQGLFAAILIAAAFYTEIPAAALGIEFTGTYLLYGLAVGTAIGLGLYVANELGSAIAKRLEIDHSEELREMLAPDSAGGWLILLVAVLPIIAIFEEFLFRAALIGAVSVGFDVSPWLLAVVSSVAFALGHGMQGTAGIAVTGLLGLVLAAAFVLTGSFLVVVVAHYLINALEFVVHEGFGFEFEFERGKSESESERGLEPESRPEPEPESETTES